FRIGGWRAYRSRLRAPRRSPGDQTCTAAFFAQQGDAGYLRMQRLRKLEYIPLLPQRDGGVRAPFRLAQASRGQRRWAFWLRILSLACSERPSASATSETP